MVLCGMVWYSVLWQHVIIGPNLVIGGLRLFGVDALLVSTVLHQAIQNFICMTSDDDES